MASCLDITVKFEKSILQVGCGVFQSILIQLFNPDI